MMRMPIQFDMIPSVEQTIADVPADSEVYLGRELGSGDHHQHM